MAKYIDADLLKAKLDEHYRKYQNKFMETRNPYTQGLIDALDLAEQVIDSLQQEQQEVDLEEEIKRVIERYIELSNDYGVIKPSGIEKIARQFYELGKKNMKQQMLKDAVEKTVGQLERQWGGNIHFMHGFEVDEMDFPFLNSQECGYGDKVHIIVLKEEEE